MIQICDEPPGVGPAVETLLDRAFGPARRQKTAERLRDGRQPAAGLAFAAVDAVDGRLLATLRLWEITAANGQPLLLLGPLAVEAAWQGGGLGGRLVRLGLRRARQAGHCAVVLVGDAPYYRRFGFSAATTGHLDLPGPVDRRRFLGLDLLPGSLAAATGVLQPAPAPAVLAAAA